ncbi:MAG: hypothetical protein A3B86_03580 [Candidatus Yanofskybacteria bacterium RIFCSPHIGHO2_02_FULL_38_22b]|uniref:Uncharacterized protein n=1 Tax=Candidatus Yanofskybacteria bacterium RIFCSPHIGHO2_02_FULL_38_22b TaxID=1802673 RepID=A0A1F8F045_9BACT|nr:MAG: hypothetical protein A3B86_03580 [Candidatus Yanofskybacteria bacterium RIFCSPHIGHO2_02_FULL_38_22b]OGN19466.1 MAG: hypothetical protein A2910_02960 [Candidatus Yanofskybacteria bacterium RIFCSPLOWO2_01_FULL_39_28]
MNSVVDLDEVRTVAVVYIEKDGEFSCEFSFGSLYLLEQQLAKIDGVRIIRSMHMSHVDPEIISLIRNLQRYDGFADVAKFFIISGLILGPAVDIPNDLEFIRKLS